ncbi:succinylglutamate desuccinylase/aspartoacylase domain-containing protein [Halocatena marina]|uniref:succinylglutamate desuccinylase/aspartoacylase domain-containing protein n=1 Tax=Halocatena marina TaxID=2934937 RepID=UPI00200BF0D8|nr:succinylglutamate desuccinylase/aspartoacylase family protein [Halocatena marina]
MRIEHIGKGEPELAILGAVHGDELCGVHAIEALLDEDPDVQKPVKCIIANEPAVEQHVRYIDTDLNRVFPGDPAAETYEPRLAYRLQAELEGCTTLSMHSTQSDGRPFAIVDESGPLAETICPQLSVAAVVEAADEFPHALVHHVDVVEVECGLQGTEQAADNAEQLVWEFLAATGALSDRSEPSERALPVLSLKRLIPKPDGGSYEVHVENFDRVEKGAVVATVDGEEITATESCYPVLVSEHGYDQRFGYTAELIDQW